MCDIKKVHDNSIPSKALYRGTLPLGDMKFDCAILDNGLRVLTATAVFGAFGRPRKGMNTRLKIDGTKIPPFIAAKNLEPYINKDIIARTQPIVYTDGQRFRTGYEAALLPKMCAIYLEARRDGVLSESQKRFAVQAEILLTAFAQVGIDALIDEATGYQGDRKHDALRLLLLKYLAEGMRKWVKTFPDSLFAEMDRLYGNETTKSNKRPQYYGKFINEYIYKPIENGYLKNELNKVNIDDKGKRRARFHQWLTDSGRTVLVHQIGRVEGLLGVCDNISDFKSKIAKQRRITIAPQLFDNDNQIINV